MTDKNKTHGGDLFIVDNSDSDWKVQRYLHDWTELATSFDIATGYFEIGALLGLDGQWQKIEKIRILMGDEVSKRTRRAILEGLQTKVNGALDASIEREKEKNDFLTGVPAIVDALRKGQIECRVYTKDKFHAKAYITHAKQAVVGAVALVGSSNFTAPGLIDNVELNIQVRREVDLLQDWYERHWKVAEDITPGVLRVIERHTQDFTPFEVYAKALFEYYAGHEMTVGEWELDKSKIYPLLDGYQREGYRALMKIAERHRGAFLCDGVGLGKTFVGMMVIERLLFDRKNVALIVPKSARKPVWEDEIERHLPEAYGDYSHLKIYNHTDLLREGVFEKKMAEISSVVDAIVIDEAHHFRNHTSDRYDKLFEIIGDKKQLFLLTATPINNKLLDLQHLIELFSRRDTGFFQDLGIHSLAGHFRKLERALKKVLGESHVENGEVTIKDAEETLSKDDLFRALVVQRSRAYVKKSQEQARAREILFPVRQNPKVIPYSITKTYGKLLDLIERATNKQKPLLILAPYYPLAYWRGKEEDIKPLDWGRQKQVVGLIRTQLLKRFESSAEAFQATCEDLLHRLLAFVQKHDERSAERWKAAHEELVQRMEAHYNERLLEAGRDPEEDVFLEEAMEKVELLDNKKYKVAEIIRDTLPDLYLLAEFLDELKTFSPANDDKLKSLVKLLKKSTPANTQKVLIFSEYMATTRYLARQLAAAGIGPLVGVDSASKRDRGEVIRAFSPYYNHLSSRELEEKGIEETRVLISTDVLAEGLNLQDCSCIINYDIHWNPVRLMQRIGRVDRRLDKTIENRILRDHPKAADVRGKVWIWNFLPPDDLDRLLNLFAKVSKKTLRISKVFGIEGRKLITPDDDYDALKDFSHAYEGDVTSTQEMFLAYQKLLKAHSGLEDRLKDLPLRVFSGKAHLTEDAQAVFFCYTVPVHLAEADKWTSEGGACRWYLYDFASQKIIEDPTAMMTLIQSTQRTPRRIKIKRETLTEIRISVEKHIKNTYLKSVQAPPGVAPVLKCWMELN